MALARYVTASCLHSLRWVAPLLIFVLAVVVTYAPGGTTVSTLAEGASWLFPITAWLTVATLNDEDPSQASITSAAAGGIDVARAAKLSVAAGAGITMTAVSLITAYAVDHANFTTNDLVLGVAAHLLSVVAGVALGSLCARPVVTRTAWAALAIVAVTTVDLVVPYAPPMRVILNGLNRPNTAGRWETLGIGAVETFAMAVVLLGASTYVARSRS